MRRLLLSIGNPARRDDGVAHEVLKKLPESESRSFLQLTPEVAAEIASYDVVVFIDADVQVGDLSIDEVDESTCPPPLTHAATPGQIVRLARSMFGFGGRALVCRIPVFDLSCEEGLSRRAALLPARAAAELERLPHVPSGVE
jgi:Ni,Fe-hydrogenase maturation factor